MVTRIAPEWPDVYCAYGGTSLKDFHQILNKLCQLADLSASLTGKDEAGSTNPTQI